MAFSEKTLMDVRNVSPSFVDCRHLADDKTVLKNPHKGWFFHFIDNGYGRPKYRNKLRDGDHLEWLAGLGTIYLRFDWADIETAEGVCDWSYIDEIIDEWKAYGYTFAIRICTYEALGIKYAVPEWLVKKGIKGAFYKHENPDIVGCFEPDYDDPLFLEKLDSFLAKCGEKFDGDPLIEFVEVGTFGAWGEGHAAFGRGIRYKADVLKKHVNLHLKHFPHTTVLVNDDMINNLADVDLAAADEFLHYVSARGVGLRDDSVCVEYYCENFGYNTLRAPFYHDYFMDNAPCSMELEHLELIKPENMKGGFPYLEALKRSHATFSGFHADPYVWYENFRWFSEYVANRLGYWYFIDAVDLPKSFSGSHTVMELYVRNEGFSKAYHQYELKIIAQNGDSTYVLNQESPDNRKWEGGTAYKEKIKLDFTSVPAGKYDIKIGLFERDKPILLALKSETKDRNGFYKITETVVDSI